MPSCRVTNLTPRPLNICLKQVTALYFENEVQPGQTVKFKPGKVWFTLEVRPDVKSSTDTSQAVVDDGTKATRYSLLKSAATIALLSIAIGAVAATAGAALLPEVGAAAAVSVAGGYLAKSAAVAKTAMVSHSGTFAKMSSMALPKAIDRLSAEMGGITALQREVLSIIASPTLSSDVRHRASGLLRNLHGAYTRDKASRTSATISPLSQAEADALEADIESGKVDDRVEERAVRTDGVLRVHRIYMDRRREFEVRVGTEGKMTLWDGKEAKMWT